MSRPQQNIAEGRGCVSTSACGAQSVGTPVPARGKVVMSFPENGVHVSGDVRIGGRFWWRGIP